MPSATRALKGDKGRPRGLIDELEFGGGVGTQPREVDLVVGRVGDDQILDVTGVVHDQVIDDVAVFIEHERVLGMAEFRDPGQIVREHPLQEVEGAETEDPELRHVPDVEHPRRAADRPVFLDDAGVLDRHLPARERHHARAQRDVLIVEGGTQQQIRHSRSHLPTAMSPPDLAERCLLVRRTRSRSYKGTA